MAMGTGNNGPEPPVQRSISQGSSLEPLFPALAPLSFPIKTTLAFRIPELTALRTCKCTTSMALGRLSLCIMCWSFKQYIFLVSIAYHLSQILRKLKTFVFFKKVLSHLWCQVYSRLCLEFINCQLPSSNVFWAASLYEVFKREAA